MEPETRNMKQEMIELISPWPIAGDDEWDKAIRLRLAREMSDVAFEQTVAFIEFQRKMSNQRWDNLLEQLRMFRDSFVKGLDDLEG